MPTLVAQLVVIQYPARILVGNVCNPNAADANAGFLLESQQQSVEQRLVQFFGEGAGMASKDSHVSGLGKVESIVSRPILCDGETQLLLLRC